MSVISKGCRYLLAGSTASSGIELGLFTNNHTPDHEDDEVGADYDEPVWDGYERESLTDWETIIEEPGLARRDHAPVSFTIPEGAGGVVYGYFLWDTVGGYLIGAVRFSAPLAVVPGIPIEVTPRLILRDPEAE